MIGGEGKKGGSSPEPLDPSPVDEAAELLAHLEPPPAEPELQRRQIQRALAGAAAHPRPRARVALWALGLCGAAAAVLIALVVMIGGRSRSPEAAPVLISGVIEAPGGRLAAGAQVQLAQPLTVPADSRAVLSLDAVTELALQPESTVRLRREGGWRIVLAGGEARVQAGARPAERALRVNTAEAVVEVVGTRFRVVRDATRGTTVRVDEGRVAVRARAEGRRHLVSGPDGQLQIGVDGRVRGAPADPRADAGAVATEEQGEGVEDGGAADARADADEEAQPSGAADIGRPDVAQIRRQIRGGRVDRARALIRRGRRSAVGQRRYLAELAIVEAEADLYDKRYARALAGYLRVSRRYPGTPQAEAALFAAAQLAIDHDRARAPTLLRRYEQRYPEGRFAADAARLLLLIEE